MTVHHLAFRFVHPTAQIQVFGMALYSMPTGNPSSLQVHSLTAQDSERTKLVYQDEQVRLYESLTYLPRAYLVPAAAIERPGYGVLQRMAYGDFAPERFVLLEEPLDLSPYPRPEQVAANPITSTRPDGTEAVSDCGTVRVVRYEDDHVGLDVQAQHRCFLFLGDLYYPGWQALVDGRGQRIYRANYLFRAIELTPGHHTVEFVYRPASFQIGAGISLGATLTVAVLLALMGIAPARQYMREVRAWARRRAPATLV
jgi:hypothetical protein